MSRKPPGGEKSTPHFFEFNGHRLTVIEMEGEPYYIAKDVGKMLGYAEDGSKMVEMIGREWADRLRGGHHLRFLDGAPLAELKRALNIPGDSGDVIASRTARLQLLTEPGLYRVLMLSGKPAALQFQDWLDTVVLPTIRKSGTYALPGAEAPQLDGEAAPPSPPTRRSRSHRPASSYGTARDLLELLDRYRRGRVIDAGAWHALRALAEHLDARPTPETIALPRTSTHRLLLGPVAGDLDAQIAAVLGPPPPEDSLRSSTYTTTASALKVGAECRARRARGELSEFTNMHRWFALNVWIGWIQRGHLSVERFDLLLTRIEDLADELIGPMPSLRTTGGR